MQFMAARVKLGSERSHAERGGAVTGPRLDRAGSIEPPAAGGRPLVRGAKHGCAGASCQNLELRAIDLDQPGKHTVHLPSTHVGRNRRIVTGELVVNGHAAYCWS